MEQLFKLSDGKLILPPNTGILSNGKTVSAYHMLPEAVLRSEGWKPLIDEPPPEPQEGYRIVMYYEDTQDAIVRKWRAEPIPHDEGEAQDEGFNTD